VPQPCRLGVSEVKPNTTARPLTEPHLYSVPISLGVCGQAAVCLQQASEDQ
jgi:hypothetical protein